MWSTKLYCSESEQAIGRLVMATRSPKDYDNIVSRFHTTPSHNWYMCASVMSRDCTHQFHSSCR